MILKCNKDHVIGKKTFKENMKYEADRNRNIAVIYYEDGSESLFSDQFDDLLKTKIFEIVDENSSQIIDFKNFIKSVCEEYIENNFLDVETMDFIANFKNNI